jgi:hypothetical protein
MQVIRVSRLLFSRDTSRSPERHFNSTVNAHSLLDNNGYHKSVIYIRRLLSGAMRLCCGAGAQRSEACPCHLGLISDRMSPIQLCSALFWSSAIWTGGRSVGLPLNPLVPKAS